MRKILALTAASGLALTGLVALAPAASAKDGDVKRLNSCTGGSGDAFSVVKVRDRKGGLRTDFYVKNNSVGQAWTFTLAQGGSTVGLPVTKVSRASDDDDSSDDDSRHTAEVKFRTYLSSTARPLVFTAKSGGEECTVTITQ
jgi:hypothetical protein